MATIARATVYAVLALIWVTPVGAQLATPEAAIRAQVQGFYRDDRDNRWPDVLDHFLGGEDHRSLDGADVYPRVACRAST